MLASNSARSPTLLVPAAIATGIMKAIAKANKTFFHEKLDMVSQKI
jgi:hypothetical protein